MEIHLSRVTVELTGIIESGVNRGKRRRKTLLGLNDFPNSNVFGEGISINEISPTHNV